MATIVKLKATDTKFILIGTGYGAYKATRPSFFGGNLVPHEDEGTIQVAAVTNETGNIYWIPTEKLEVVEIDGVGIVEIAAKLL